MDSHYFNVNSITFLSIIRWESMYSYCYLFWRTYCHIKYQYCNHFQWKNESMQFNLDRSLLWSFYFHTFNFIIM